MAAIIDLNRVGVFLRVVQSGSFTAAAAALSLPPSSVSRAVARLEDELGVRLLHRTTRKLALTEPGQHYFERMSVIFGEADEANRAAAGFGSEVRGTVRMTAPVDVGVSELPRLIGKLCRRYPNVVIDLTLTSRRLDLVEEGIDLALRAGQLPDSSLVTRKLGGGALGIFAAPAYLKRRRGLRTLADVAAHECVLYRARSGKAPWRLFGPTGDETVTATGHVIADDMLFVREAAIAGLGLALLPFQVAARAVAARRLVRVLPGYAAQLGGVYLVWPSRRLVPAHVAAARDFLADELAKLA